MRALSGGRVASPPHPPHPLPVPRQFLISSTPPQCPHTRILHVSYVRPLCLSELFTCYHGDPPS